MKKSIIRAYPRDQRLEALLLRLINATRGQRPPATPRTYAPGRTAIAAMSTRQLVRETVSTYRHSPQDQGRKDLLSQTFADRGLMLAAGVVATGMASEALDGTFFGEEDPSRLETTVQGINDGLDNFFSPGEFNDIDPSPAASSAIFLADIEEQGYDEQFIATYEETAPLFAPDLSAALGEQEALATGSAGNTNAPNLENQDTNTDGMEA